MKTAATSRLAELRDWEREHVQVMLDVVGISLERAAHELPEPTLRVLAWLGGCDAYTAEGVAELLAYAMARSAEADEQYVVHPAVQCGDCNAFILLGGCMLREAVEDPPACPECRSTNWRFHSTHDRYSASNTWRRTLERIHTRGIVQTTAAAPHAILDDLAVDGGRA